MITMNIKYFPNQMAAYDYMKREAAKRDGRLAENVGNDMSYTFYVAAGRWVERFYPDGIGGRMEYLDYTPTN
jgi:hypothetical protein